MFQGAGVGRVRFEEGVQGGGVDSVGQGGVEEPLPPGPVLSQRDKAPGALTGVGSGGWTGEGVAVHGVGGGVIAPETSLASSYHPTHAEMVARLHELYDSEKKVFGRVEEAKGRLEKAWTKVMEEEEVVVKVDGELKGIKDQIKALLKEEEERKERRRREEEAGGDDMEDSAFVEEAGSSEEVGVRVEVGKRIKVARQGRCSGSGVGSGGGRLDVEEEIRQLGFRRRIGGGACVLLLFRVMRKSLGSRMRIQVEQPFGLLH